MLKIKFFIFFMVVLSFFVMFGCSSDSFSQKTTEDLQKTKKNVFPNADRELKGFYHVIKKGESLSQISRRYNVNLGKIIKLNHFPDKNNIVAGQLIFIPSSPDFLEFSEDKSNRNFNFIWPVKGKVISEFINKNGKFKPYIDIKKLTNSQVVAIDDGIVSFCSKELENTDKKIVMVKHKREITSIYIYNGKVLVNVNDEVAQGQPIFNSSDNIEEKQSDVLRFEIRQSHMSKDPISFLPQRKSD